MEFAYDARIPDDYIGETGLRLEIYHRLGDTTSFEEVDEILAELKDRFGTPPEPILWLYHLTRIRVFAAQNYLISLKFEKFTFTAEWHKGKTTVKKTLPLKPFKKPQDLEAQVISALAAVLY